MTAAAPKTAFVFAGGGSLGAVQVGMLEALLAAGVTPDLLVGSSVGALNAGFFAGNPTADGVAKLAAVWRTLRRRDIFPVTLKTTLSWLGSPDGLFESASLRRLVSRNLLFENLEQAPVPLHVVATRMSGASVVLSAGPAVDAILASAAIPLIFPAVAIGEDSLMDGAVSGNTPILSAVELGAERLIVLPTGFACALNTPPRGGVARAFHALTLLIAHQMIRDLAHVAGTVQVFTAPSLCPLDVSPFDFSHTDALMARASAQTRAWIAEGGLSRQEIPDMLRPHAHP